MTKEQFILGIRRYAQHKKDLEYLTQKKKITLEEINET